MSGHFGGYHHADKGARSRLTLLLGLAFLFVASTSLLILLKVVSSDGESIDTTVVVERDSTLEMADVLVPVQSIESGTLLEPAMFRIESRPKIGLSDKLIRDYEQIQGLYSRTLIVANQPLHGEFVTNIRPVNSITALIPEGYRAVTIKVDERTGIEGWARAGARVDVNWASTIRGKQASTVIVQNAKVISAARKIETQNAADGTVPTELTLLVSIGDSNRILLAQQTGSLSLSLRGDRESGKATANTTITVDDLLGGAPAPDLNKKPDSLVRVRDQNGQYTEFVLQDGKLVPFLDAISNQ